MPDPIEGADAALDSPAPWEEPGWTCCGDEGCQFATKCADDERLDHQEAEKMKRYPDVTWYASRFQIVTGIFRGHKIVEWGGGDCGLYMRFFYNHFGTPLAASGPCDQIHALVKEVLPKEDQMPTIT